MDSMMTDSTLIERLETQSDDDLRTIITRANQILTTRDDDRKQQALAAIRQLAKEHGLNVAVKKPARKRGRPPKTKVGS